jgi:hypothetical protein
MRSPARFNRKQWEHVYILETLRQRGLLRAGARGIGFGCGREPLVSLMARYGCQVLASDLRPEAATGRGWIETSKQALNQWDLCSPAEFDRNVAFQHVDMNRVPHDLRGFDFTWSSCSLEHLGSLDRGLDFILASVHCLRPGGVAVHTTEFNLSSNDETLEDPNCVIYRQTDIEAFIARCASEGITVAPPNWNAGLMMVDRHIDAPPYSASPNLKLRLSRYVATSLGIILTRAG